MCGEDITLLLCLVMLFLLFIIGPQVDAISNLINAKADEIRARAMRIRIGDSDDTD